MRATTTRVWTLLVCCGVIACGDDSGFEVPQTTIASPITEVPAEATKVASCDGASNGTPCGNAGSRMHCVLNDCVKNACGDGVVADGEECDDGNERNDDGCDSRCMPEPPPGCGNGVVEAGEQCDDSNTKDDDQCTHICTTARCGDRIVSRGEECDDGNANDIDGCSNRCRLPQNAGGAGGSMTPTAAGSSAGGAGALAGLGGAGGGAGTGGSGAAGRGGTGGATAGRGGAGGTGSGGVGTSGRGDAGSGGAGTGLAGTGAAGTGNAGAGVDGGAGTGAAGSGASGSGAAGSGGDSNPACSACRTQYCRDYQGSGLDVVAGCFEKVNGDLGADPADPNFIQDCVDVIQCAFQNNCAYAVNGASDCYCGSATADACINSGPAADAKCVPQFQKAARSTANTDITLRMSDFAYPVGWAFFLLECDRDFCKTQCTPP
jgi:cysteine-rich repeat protein